MRTLVFPVGCVLITASAFFAATSVAQSTSNQSPGESSSPQPSSGRAADSTSSSAGQKKAAAKSSASNSQPEKGETGSEAAKAKAVPGKNGQPKVVPGKSGISKVLPGITPEREAAVMTFVQRHHPELTELLIHLKENAPKEYDRAVRDLLRTSERLAQIQERDSLTYELELQSWKARSRAQLLAARLQMGESLELREQLRAALNEEYDLRLRLLERDREKAAERVKNLGEQIDRISQRRSEEIDRQLKQLTSTARGGDTNAKGKAKAKPKVKVNANANENSPAKNKTERRTD